ncbi:MAG: hypothetical protein PHX20_02615 [Candidatus Omnitrophica bacterium]|nr:hypothetical protein [Candidatus Omnitrophota bacterium]MDD5436415.1 hypothetical protein [Candidatus Omnitrophota bacterium]
MRKSSFFIIALALFYAVYGHCADTRTPLADTKGSIYSYSDSDIPEVFFFPKEKARWDGTKVTMREWYMLTDLQKEKFISEYLGELKTQYKDVLEALGLDYLKALNLFSYYSNEKAQNEPSTKFLDLLIKGQGGVEKK